LLKSFKDKAHLARQLSLPEWLALVEAWWMLFGFHLALRWASYDHLITLTRPLSEEKADSSSILVFAQRLKRLVDLASRLHLLPMTCLVKAFTLRWMLGRRGIPSQLRLGASKTLAEIHAHAWVEINGQTVGESEDITERFKVLDSSERTIS
jgi:hypothetical protein